MKLNLEDGKIIKKNLREAQHYLQKIKKLNEKELENKYKKDLSNLLAQDIIFLLRNQ